MDQYTLIPSDQISKQALDAIVEEYILREGTDYGLVERSLSEKKTQILKQLQKQEIHIVFDPTTESVTILTEQQLKKLNVKN